MKKTVSLGLILLFLIVTVGFAGCTGSDPIVGSWEESKLGEKVVFNADHTVSLNIKGSVVSQAMTVPGTWTNEGDGVYTAIYTLGHTPSQVYTYQISKSGKSMTSGDGNQKETFIKGS